MKDLRTALAWTLSGVLALGVAVAYIRNVPAAATASDTAEGHLAQGLRLHQVGNIDGAIAEYQRAATIDRRSALAYYDLGVAYYQQKRVDEAIASYTQAIVLDSNMTDAHFNLGYVLLHDRKDPSGALEQLKRAVELDPKLAKGYYEMGLAYDLLAMSDRARAAYDQAVTLDPGFKAIVSKNSPPR